MIDRFTDSLQAQGRGSSRSSSSCRCAHREGPGVGRLPVRGQHGRLGAGPAAARAGERAHRIHRVDGAGAGYDRHVPRRPADDLRRLQNDGDFASTRRAASTRTTCARRAAAVDAGHQGATDWRGTPHCAEARIRFRHRIEPAGHRVGPAGAARQGGRRGCPCASSGARPGRTRIASRSCSASSSRRSSCGAATANTR